jgi:DNA-directed RNA polymerase subunit RPC12/RpoP
MSIRFACEKCGHVFDVADEAEGRHGRCRRCGHHVIVPVADASNGAGLRLKPIEADAAERSPAHLLDSPPPLSLRPDEAKDINWPAAVSRETADDQLHNRGRPNYDVGQRFDGRDLRSSTGPTPLWWNFPSLTARLIARWLRKTRDVLYYVSLASLVLILYGFLFKAKMLLHLGAVLIVGSNISMFCVGTSYLFTLPFKDSLRQGLACLVPFYAVYYWISRWHRMRQAVLNTLAAFIPMLLVALAYFFYQEAPAIENEVERLGPRIESEADEVIRDLERIAK